MTRPATQKLNDWRVNPVQFVHEQFGIEPDIWQQEALKVFPSQDPDKMRISLQACVGPGKTSLLSWCGWNFLSCYGDKLDHPKGAAVSVTQDNLKDNLWPEFSKWQNRSPFLLNMFEWTKERIFNKQHPETWFISARSWSKNSNPDEQGRTLSGLHSRYVLALIDESGEIPVPVSKAAEQALSTKDLIFGKIMQAGNPSSLDGILYAASTELRHLWYVIRITGDPDDPKRSPRIDINWAREQIKTHGRDDPWIMYSILGMFPPSSINTLLGPDEVAQAMELHLAEDKYNFSQKRLGIDVARFGDDRTVIFPRQGLAAFRPVEMRSATTTEISARVIAAKMKWKSEGEFVDGTGGFGSGVIDSMMMGGHTPHEIHFSSKAIDPRYYNKRTEMWFEIRNWLRRGGALPKMAQLQKELVTPTYTTKGGKIILEPKEMIKKRLKFSPDLADALALTFAIPDGPATGPYDHLIRDSGRGKLVSDYDPFA